MEFSPFVLCSEDSSEVRIIFVFSNSHLKYDDRIGTLILLIFFGMLLFGYGYVYLFIPETRGLTLEEVRTCTLLFVAIRESYGCRSMKCIVRVLNLGTPLNGNRILVKKPIGMSLRALIESRERRRGPLQTLKLYPMMVHDLMTVNDLTIVNISFSISNDMYEEKLERVLSPSHLHKVL